MIATFKKCDNISSWRPKGPQIRWGELIAPLGTMITSTPGVRRGKGGKRGSELKIRWWI